MFNLAIQSHNRAERRLRSHKGAIGRRAKHVPRLSDQNGMDLQPIGLDLESRHLVAHFFVSRFLIQSNVHVNLLFGSESALLYETGLSSHAKHQLFLLWNHESIVEGLLNESKDLILLLVNLRLESGLEPLKTLGGSTHSIHYAPGLITKQSLVVLLQLSCILLKLLLEIGFRVRVLFHSLLQLLNVVMLFLYLVNLGIIKSLPFQILKWDFFELIDLVR